MDKQTIAAARAKRLADVPAHHQSKYRKAYALQSRQMAIRAFCLECVGWDSREVQLCTCPACPLYGYRLATPARKKP